MASNNKTRKVAVYPDGQRVVIVRRGGMYHWGQGRASSHMSGVVHCLAVEYGGHVETEPNPFYREPTPYEVLSRLLSGKR